MSGLIQQLQAQYAQRQYNLSYAPALYRNENFEYGICTKVNYNAGDTNNYFLTAIGTSLSNYAPFTSPDTIYNGHRVRFVRNNRAGNSLNNRGYEFRKSTEPSKWYNSEAHSIAEVDNVAKNGGYCITGSVTNNTKTAASVAGGANILFARLGATGNVMSAISIDHAGASETGNCIRRSTAPGVGGTFLICGSARISSVRTDIFVARVDTLGSVLWFKTFNIDTTYSGGSPTAHCIAYSLTEAPSDPTVIPSFWGGIHVVGTYQDASSAQLNGFYLRLQPNGDYITSCMYYSPFPGAGTDDVVFRSIKWSRDNNLIVTGYTNGLASGLAGGPHTLLIKLTPIIGGLLGTRIIIARDPVTGAPIPSFGMDVVERINTASIEEYYISGWCQDAGFASLRNLVFKVDFNGFPIAQYLYARANMFAANGIDFVRNTLFRPGFTLFSGAQNPASAVISDGYVAKSYFNGCRCTNNCGFIQPQYAQLNVPGTSTLIDTSITYTITKLTPRTLNYQTILICNQNTIGAGSNARESFSEQILDKGSINLYPNPVSEQLYINIEVQERKEARLVVYDVSGKLVLEDFTDLEAGQSEIQLNTEELMPGFYILEVSGNNFQFRNKFVKN